jgi:hypothetical protein
MRRRIALIVVAAFLVALPAAAQDYRKGVKAYHVGDYVTALLEWYPLAEKGDAQAQNSLGVMYENGHGVAQDYAEAVRWYRKAAAQGSASAMLNLGGLYDAGKGVPRDRAEAVAWYGKAAGQGEPRPITPLGFMRGTGRGVPPDDTVRKAAEPVEPAEPTKPASPPSKRTDAGVKSAKILQAKREDHQAPVPKTPALPVGKGVRIQLSSVKSKADALKEAGRLARAHGSVLGSLKIVLVRADLGPRGIFYRLRAGPLGDRAAARALCRKLWARDQGCIVIKP